MITIYVDPNDSNQVMAYYRGCKPGNPSSWINQGFIEIQVDERHMQFQELVKYQRNCQFLNNVVIPRVNPIQPVKSASTISRIAAQESGRVRLIALGFTDEELKAMGLG